MRYGSFFKNILLVVVFVLIIAVYHYVNGDDASGHKSFSWQEVEQGQFNDFGFITATGEKSSLHKIDSQYTLLFFYNLNNQSGRDFISEMESSSVLKGVQASGILKVLSIYTADNVEEYMDYHKNIPCGWINARCNDMKEVHYLNLGCCQEIPVFILLDRYKQILIGYIDYSELELWLRENIR